MSTQRQITRRQTLGAAVAGAAGVIAGTILQGSEHHTGPNAHAATADPKRTRALVAAKPPIRRVFSARGGLGGLYESRLGTEGLITQRAVYADVLIRIWELLQSGSDPAALKDAYSKFLLMVNLCCKRLFCAMTQLDRSRRLFLRTCVALAATTPLISGWTHAQSNEALGPLMAYVGTFSSPLRDVLPTQVDLPPGNGRGIHLFQVNRVTGAMTPAGIYEMGTSPSCLVLNTAGTRLYSSNETDRVGKDKEGTVSAFSIDRTDGHLTLLNTVASGGAGPTYVSIHPAGRFVFVANYFGGSVAVLPILPDGRLADATDIKNDAGQVGPVKATSAPPGSFAFSGHDRTHAHMIQADPSGRFVLHVDLGLDQIFVWKFDAQRGVLTPSEPPAVSLPPGDGPRHFHFHPHGRWFYSIQEEGSTIVLFDYDARAGRLAARQTVSTLPPGFAGSNFCSEILVSADGQFVYAGNRLHDSIGIFSVGPDGALTYLGEEWTRGNYPRSFNFDPTGRFLYCCNQRGDNIAVFRVARNTGGLQFTGHYTPVGNPSIIVFLDLAASRKP